ncbi:MAG: hypothetical protein AAB558_03635 [Patescibacteria group bacterium]
MDTEIVQKELELIKQRNQRVEADKAWETSLVRIGSVAVITYAVALLVMRALGVERFWLQAFIPSFGYILSTQSLPLIKRWWIKKFFR